jgi:predicted TIM-barrel fold metal-dependent hydrolase
MIKNGHRTEAFTYQECIHHMDEAGVDRVMIVPGSWEGDRIDYEVYVVHNINFRAKSTARSPAA